VESEHDVIIPHQVVLNYRDALAATRSLTYRVIGGADHGLAEPRWQQAYTTILVSWLSEMIRGARAEAQAKPVVAKSPKVEVAASD
jgi:hypothetical protein